MTPGQNIYIFENVTFDLFHDIWYQEMFFLYLLSSSRKYRFDVNCICTWQIYSPSSFLSALKRTRLNDNEESEGNSEAILRQFFIDFPFDEHYVEDDGEHNEKKRIMKILMKLKNRKRWGEDNCKPNDEQGGGGRWCLHTYLNHFDQSHHYTSHDKWLWWS